MNLSVAIITFNEASNIERCIKSVQKIADDIIVVDSYSTDNTVEIAQSLGARIVQQKFLGHIEQKNFEDMSVPHEEVGDNNLEYLLSQEEIPAYVRGLIKRSKTKKISLSDAMDEWFEENKNKFDNPKKEWFQVKNVWMDYANKMKSKERVKKFK